jgi:glycosyltransferase involved in cell wall biosynthesis
MVSVIVPIYNTEEYLDQCIVSIANQTYQSLDIILINDGSTDSSGEIAQGWKVKDSRITLINKQNEGQGIARTLGVHMAKGEYLIFIDSDDYIEPTLVEKSLHKIRAYDAEICIFDYYRVNQSAINEEHAVIHFQDSFSTKEYPGVLSGLSGFTCTKLYKTDLIRRTDIPYINNICEDVVMSASLYAKAKSIVTIDAPLYYYRYIRPGNLSTSYWRYDEITDSLVELKNVFLKNGCDFLLSQIYWISFSLLKHFLMRMLDNKTDFDLPTSMKERYSDYLSKYEKYLLSEFSTLNRVKLLNSNFFIFGSYNLRPNIRELLLDESRLVQYYGASSIVSAMCDANQIDSFTYNKGANEYRREQVFRDINRSFLNSTDLTDCDYIVIDFLEEVCPILKLGDAYYTYSEFFQETVTVSAKDYELIAFTDQRRISLWKSACIDFVNFLRRSGKTVIIIENLLCVFFANHYDVLIKYDNADEIQNSNNILNMMISFFRQNMPEAKFVVPEEKYRFTAGDFYFGCKPEYYNYLYYKDVAEKISLVLYGEDHGI